MHRKGSPLDRVFFAFLLVGNPLASEIFRLPRCRMYDVLGFGACCSVAGSSIYFIGVSEYSGISSKIALACLACFSVATLLHFARKKLIR